MVLLEVLLLLMVAHPGLEGLPGVDACTTLQAEGCPVSLCSFGFYALLGGRCSLYS